MVAENASTASDRVVAQVRAVADPGAVVEMFGSSVYAPAHASDVDVLVAGDDPARLAAELGLTVIPTVPPRMTGSIDGVKVDVTVVMLDVEDTTWDLARRAPLLGQAAIAIDRPHQNERQRLEIIPLLRHVIARAETKHLYG